MRRTGATQECHSGVRGDRRAQRPTTPARAIMPSVGDRVCVKPSLTSPRYGWGNVEPSSIGVLSQIDDDGSGDCTVCFPEHSSWRGILSELEVTSSGGGAVTVGGLVKILSASNSSTSPYVGQEGCLIEDDGTDRPYRVEFDDGLFVG